MLYEDEVQYSEKAILRYEIPESGKGNFVWNIELHTGKYHQIRAQLARMGCPVIGDHLYGSTIPYQPDCIALHAWKLVFYHPLTNEELCMVAKSEFA